MPRTTKSQLFHTAHYNLIAAEVKSSLDSALSFHNNWGGLSGYDNKGHYYATEALVVLAINFAKRFKADNPRFDPIQFLDACSPNVELYPLSDLWENG